jgi:hypothetical protein
MSKVEPRQLSIGKSLRSARQIHGHFGCAGRRHTAVRRSE